MKTLPADSLIAHTLEKMTARLVKNPFREDGRLGDGLLFTGNVHDAVPRRLLLDIRLSPLDKMAWMMIRLHAQNNQGAVFPSYDELQLQLASPGKGRASRETVSRVLLMLRITGWLSLCKRVRDDKGRIRGNIYAQHDEPLTFRDAESLDPRFLDTVATACLSKNQTIRHTAWNVLQEIKNDPTMRHYHTHISMLESRLGSPQQPQQMAAFQKLVLGTELSQSKTELSKKRTKNHHKKPGSETELSKKEALATLSSDTEIPEKSISYGQVRKPNHYVRNITHSVTNTYVLPDELTDIIPSEERSMLTGQLQALPEDQAQKILMNLQALLATKQLINPTGWLLAMMKKARDGTMKTFKNKHDKEIKPQPSGAGAVQPPQPFMADLSPVRQRQPASKEQVHRYVSELRARLQCNRNRNDSGNSAQKAYSVDSVNSA